VLTLLPEGSGKNLVAKAGTSALHCLLKIVEHVNSVGDKI